LNPKVTVCPYLVWDEATESCPSPFAVFSKEPDSFGTVLGEKEGAGEYGVALKHRDYPFEAGERFRVAVEVSGKLLGWADLKAYDVSGPTPRLDEDGYVILDTGTENFNISFRIAEGFLEAEYCDLSSVEDCDVEIFAYEESGCLRVFENPGDTGETLGSQACVPANAAELDGNEVSEYAVILTLERADQFQSGDVPASAQVPFFPDLQTDPPGIEFNVSSDGAGVVICQAPVVSGGIPEELHDQLRPFIVYANGETVLPGRDEYSFGAPECEGFGSHPHTASSTSGENPGGSLLDRFAAGLSNAASFFLPQPLNARRLHGGLNTTVYDTKSSPPRSSAEASPGQAALAVEQAQETFIVEFGALLDLDPETSVASVPASGKVGEETTITVNVLNAQGLPYPFEVPVELTVTSDSDVLEVSADFLGGGVYSATYAPTTAGSNLITITIDGFEIAGSPFTMNVLPVVGDLTVVVDISGGAPADGLPVYLYQGSNVNPLLEGVTDGDGAALFPQIPVGKSYTIHLPKRDFDVTFTTMTEVIDFQEEERTVTFYGNTQDLGPGVRVFRVKEIQGTGNAYRYVAGGRSWVSANNQVQDSYLEGVQGHLVDILSQEENDFVKDFFSTDPDLCPGETNENKCKDKAWIGLTDDEVETVFEWITGEETVYFNWPDGPLAEDQPLDRKGNLDHVEIGFSGIWGIINGASSTNDGYFVEWDVEWPDTPPSSG
jgi:hypothetical protein